MRRAGRLTVILPFAARGPGAEGWALLPGEIHRINLPDQRKGFTGLAYSGEKN